MIRAISEADPDRSRVRELVARCLDQLEDRGIAIVDELCADAPELAEKVRRRIESLQRLALASNKGGAHDGFPEQLGEFRLKRLIGGGGMGVVYLAERTSLGRLVALKLIRPDQLYFPKARERFRREVDAVARLRHPAVVPIYTFVESAGVPYYAMECIDGASLEEVLSVLRGRRPQDLSGADLRVALRACRDARAADLLPHDLATPGDGPGSPFAATNWVEACFRLMLTRDERVLVVDFGLASARGSTRLTATGALLGSLPFTPPEILGNGADRCDARSDSYSLGVTLYELLTLSRAFGAENETVERTRAAILTGAVRPPRSLHPALPCDAETVCPVAMERERPMVDLRALNARLEVQVARTRRAVTSFLETTGNLSLANVPGADGLRRDLVAEAVATLALLDGPDALPVTTFADRATAATVRTNHSVLLAEREAPEALAALGSAWREWAALHAERPDHETLANLCGAIGHLIFTRDLPLEDALAALHRLEELLPAGSAAAEDEELALRRATALFHFGARLASADHGPDAIPRHREAIAELVALDARLPDRLKTLQLQSAVRLELGPTLRVGDRTDDAIVELRNAHALAVRIAALFPSRVEFRSRVGIALLLQAEAELDRGDAAASAALAALRAAETTRDGNPRNASGRGARWPSAGCPSRSGRTSRQKGSRASRSPRSCPTCSRATPRRRGATRGTATIPRPEGASGASEPSL
ncbi:MAG: serine/threonine protein kinase [Planctomycetes bacterium]|nr:serine/threonine protein kinase [Planctomycetota bacterium]